MQLQHHGYYSYRVAGFLQYLADYELHYYLSIVDQVLRPFHHPFFTALWFPVACVQRIGIYR